MKKFAQLSFARYVSLIFSPALLLPLSFLIAIFYGEAFEREVSGVLLVFLILGLVPMITAFLALKRFGKISDWDVSRRSERQLVNVVMMTILTFLYFVYRFVFVYPSAQNFIGFFIIWYGLYSVITAFWKISLHTASFTFFALVFWILVVLPSTVGFPLVIVLLAISLLSLGLVTWSRIYLQHHTFFQTTAGIGLTFGVVWFTTQLRNLVAIFGMTFP